MPLILSTGIVFQPSLDSWPEPGKQLQSFRPLAAAAEWQDSQQSLICDFIGEEQTDLSYITKTGMTPERDVPLSRDVSS